MSFRSSVTNEIRLTPGASDDSLIKILKEFNQGVGKDGPLFHSIFDGKDTRFLLFRSPVLSRGVGLVRATSLVELLDLPLLLS